MRPQDKELLAFLKTSQSVNKKLPPLAQAKLLCRNVIGVSVERSLTSGPILKFVASWNEGPLGERRPLSKGFSFNPDCPGDMEATFKRAFWHRDKMLEEHGTYPPGVKPRMKAQKRLPKGSK